MKDGNVPSVPESPIKKVTGHRLAVSTSPIRYTPLMLMVIFGAGASYDSASDFPLPRRFDGNTGGPWRPPLAKDLFRDPNLEFGLILRKYPKLSHILPFLREPAPERSVEEELEVLKDQGGNERIRELAAVCYYLRDLLFYSTIKWEERVNGVTNYAPLIGDILRLNEGDQPVCLVTFNYDLLLDHVLLSYDYKPKELQNQSHFQAHSILKLFKPHGSADWVRFVDIPATDRLRPDLVIGSRETICLLDEWARISGPEWADDFGLGRTVFPAIAIPFQNKTEDTFAWPPSHAVYLKQLLPDVTKILIIGWAAKEAHFLEILRNSKLPLLRNIMVVGSNPEDAQATLQSFVEQVGKRIGADLLGRNCSTGSAGFTQFIIGREAEPFLQTQ